MTSRREFLHRAGAASVLWGMADMLDPFSLEAAPVVSSNEWDVTWVQRMTGKHRVVFDAAEVEGSAGIRRAAAWVAQYQAVLKVTRAALTPVIIIRHKAVVLGFSNAFWTRYGVGARYQVTHPMTGAPTDRNPATFDESDGLPPGTGASTLPSQVAGGAIVLACDLALRGVTALVREVDKVPEPEARRIALEAMLPGVILQPSGVFGAVLAQEAGCVYVKAS